MDGLASAFAAEAVRAQSDMTFARRDMKSLQQRNDVQDEFNMPMAAIAGLPVAYGRIAETEALEGGLANTDAMDLIMRADGEPLPIHTQAQPTPMEGLVQCYAAEAWQAASDAKFAVTDMRQLQARADAMDTGSCDGLPDAYRRAAASDLFQASLAQADAHALRGRYDSPTDEPMGMDDDAFAPHQSEEEAEAYDSFEATPQIALGTQALSAGLAKPDLAKPGSGFMRQISDASTAPSELAP